MKARMILAVLLFTYLLAGCDRTTENYISKREKTPDMQDAKILAMKTETAETEMANTEARDSTEEATEPAVSENPEEDDEAEQEGTTTAELNGFLNMRSGPGVDFDVILLLEEGDQILLMGEENGEDDTLWYRVSYGDVRGYVEQEALQLVLVPEED